MIRSALIALALVAVLFTATIANADTGRIVVAETDSLSADTQSFMYGANNEYCFGLLYIPGTHGNWGTWLITNVPNPMITYSGMSDFNPIVECETFDFSRD